MRRDGIVESDAKKGIEYGLRVELEIILSAISSV